MPIYEYKCEACGERLEKLQRISDMPLTECPRCGESALRRLVSSAAFRLKGSGWYETDFKKDGRRNVHGDEKPADDSQADKKPDKTEAPGKDTAKRDSAEPKSSDKADKSSDKTAAKKTSDSGKPATPAA